MKGTLILSSVQIKKVPTVVPTVVPDAKPDWAVSGAAVSAVVSGSAVSYDALEADGEYFVESANNAVSVNEEDLVAFGKVFDTAATFDKFNGEVNKVFSNGKTVTTVKDGDNTTVVVADAEGGQTKYAVAATKADDGTITATVKKDGAEKADTVTITDTTFTVVRDDVAIATVTKAVDGKYSVVLDKDWAEANSVELYKKPAVDPNAPTPTPGESTATPTATATATPTPAPTNLVLQGDVLGEGATFTYEDNGLPKWQTVQKVNLDKSKIVSGKDIVVSWTVVDKAGNDVKATRAFNFALLNGTEWNSPVVDNKIYGKTGGTFSYTVSAEKFALIEDSICLHMSTSDDGFDGKCKVTDVKVDGQSIVKGSLPDEYTYKAGVTQWGQTAKVDLPSDIDFSKYKTCEIEFDDNNNAMKFQGIVVATIGGAEKADPMYNEEASGDKIIVNLSNVKAEGAVTNPYVKLQTADPGFIGTVKITKITFVLAD